MPVLQSLGKLSGPRQVLLGTVALLLASSGLPWYHLENRGFTFDLNGWHEIGPLLWGMAILLIAWEFSRMARIVPVGGDEGDRVSAIGGLAVAFVGVLFVVRRLLDGDLGYGWLIGAVLLAALGASSAILFDAARGRESLAARFGDGEAPVESRPHDPDAPRPGAPPTPEWRRPQRDAAGETPVAVSPAPTWRAKDAEWTPGARPAWRTEEAPPADAERLSWRGPADPADPGPAPAPDAPVVPAARVPIVPSGPGPSVAPEPPRPPVAPHRVDDRGGWTPPWRRGRRDSADAADESPRGPGSKGRTPTRRPTEDVPPWRAPGDASPPPGGWPKSIAEKQRDEPPLWG